MLTQTAKKEQPEKILRSGKDSKDTALITALRKESGQTALDDLHVYIYSFEMLGYVSLP